MRKGFTLIELLVVVGIMGMLGVAATGGYAALQRGMEERSAVAVAASLLRSAQERAHVDRLPTVVFCYNRLVKAPTGDEDENGVAVGVMTAIRRAGRLSYVRGELLFDEFADLDSTYEWVKDRNDAQKGGSFRLFKFSGVKPSRMEYSIVSDQIVRDETSEMVTLFSGAGNGMSQTNLLSSAFYDLGGGTASGWSVGDGYAFEFAEVQLPNGFVFGNKVPSDPGQVSEAEVIFFDPEVDRSSETVEIWSTKPDASGYPKAFKKAGTASADSEKAV